MTTTIPFIAYEISGLAFPTTTGYYNSGAVNYKFISQMSSNIDARIDALGGFDEADYITSANAIARFADSRNVASRFAPSQSSFVTNWTDLTDAGETTLHIHDGRYYTEAESLANFAGSSEVRLRFPASSTAIARYADSANIHTKFMASANSKKALASAQALKIHAFHAKVSSSYLAANYGWSEITSGSKRITHALAGAPNIINITPSGLVTFAYAVYNPNATDFTVAITAAGSRVIRWHAQI